MEDKKDDFEKLVTLHAEVKAYKTDISLPLLRIFKGKNDYKFERTIDSDKWNRWNLSSTSTCANALAEYVELWNDNKLYRTIFNNDYEEYKKFINLKGYWDYLIRGLKAEKQDIETPDSFTTLNILSCLSSILAKINMNKKQEEKLLPDSEIQKIFTALCTQFKENQCAFIENPHPFMFYKFLSMLEDWKDYHFIDENEVDSFKKTIYSKGKYELYRQIALYDSKDQSLFDVKRLVYSLLIVQRHGRYSNNLIVERAIKIIFQEQLVTGLLPVGHVVDNDFVVKNGNVEKMEVSASPLLTSFECFNDLLASKDLRNELKKYCVKLELAYIWAHKRLRRDDRTGNILGWYPEYESTHVPISWFTGHILIFLKKYCELLSELISESASNYLQAKKVTEVDFFDTFDVITHVDSMITGEHRSALIFGPPGTGKSTIPKYLAMKLKWQYVEIIPGQFLSNGPLNIIPRANEIFERLMKIRNAVIFFDEVDQFVKQRTSDGNNEAEGPVWIVTVLLPKFSELRKRKDIRFILATNRIDVVDTAIARQGRIDLILPMGGINWRERVKILKDSIDAIPDAPEFPYKQTLRDQLIPNIDDKVISELKNTEKDAFKKTCPSTLKIFLERTNYISYLRLKQILEELFDKTTIAQIQSSLQYGLFFKGENLSVLGKFEDKELRHFHEEYLKTNLGKIRLPLKSHPQGATIQDVDDNIF